MDIKNFNPKHGFSSRNLIAIIKDWALIAIGVGIAAHLVDGISYDTGWTLLLAVVVMSLFNLILKPLLILFTLPFIIFTFGIGLLFINALLFILVGKVVPGFHVDSYMAAFWGALIVSLVSLLVNTFLKSGNGKGGRRSSSNKSSSDSQREKLDKGDDDDVIDI